MMVYEAFLKTVKASLQSHLGEDFTVVTRPVPKNNGYCLDGLNVIHKSRPLSPVIYMNPYYIAYEAGITMEEILEDILLLVTDSEMPEDIQLDNLTDISHLSDRIIYQLVNAPANEDLLSEIPYIPFPDLGLALIFYLYLEDNKNGRIKALIRNTHLRMWEVTEAELYDMAAENTPALFPPVIRTMCEVMEDIIQKLQIDPEDELAELLMAELNNSPVKLYSLSNPTFLDGACCMMYSGVLKDFADQMGTDLLILPSSIHEVLLASYQETISYPEMSETILRINGTDVPAEEQLSNIIYYYSRSSDRITVAYDPSVPIGTENP